MSPSFVKWAGGKKQLLTQFKSHIPKEINRYFEPFVGGGAVAFHIIKNHKPKEVILSDTNEELINAYLVIRDNTDELISLLKEMKRNHSKEVYYKIRAENPSTLSNIKRAARFIYLNKTCFNGLYRVNSKGQFNVPIGSYKNPAICSEKELREISKLLKNVELKVMPFEKIVKHVKENDFVYFDPPYYPLKNNGFTRYTKDDFLEKEHKQLAKVFKRLDKKGAKVMLSNSDTDFIKELYKEHNISFVKANRMINCDANGRGKVREIVVTNYPNTIKQVTL